MTNRTRMIQDMARLACLVPSTAMLGDPELRRFFETVPADLGMRLPSHKTVIGDLSLPGGMAYLIRWTEVQARARALRFGQAIAADLVSHVQVRMYRFVVGDSRRSLFHLMEAGEITTYRDLACKITAIARGGPRQEWLEEYRRSCALPEPDGNSSASPVTPCVDDPEHLDEGAGDLLIEAIQRAAMDGLDARIRKVTRQLERVPARDMAARTRLEAKITTLKSERSYQLLSHDGYTFTREMVARQTGADPARMSDAWVYVRRKAEARVLADPDRALAGLDLDLRTLAAEIGLSAFVVDTLLDVLRARNSGS